MCFSATASFSSAALLFSVGAGTALINRSNSHKMFVSIPLLFGIQQASEGIIWISLGQNVPSLLPQTAMMIFLFIAWAVWPAWIPWSILNIETNKIRRRVLWCLCGIGIFGSAAATLALMTGSAQYGIVGHSIDYSLKNRFHFLSANLESIVYTSSTLVPFFVSSYRLVQTMGILIVIGLIVTLVIKHQTLTSVWCFFAALVSFFIAAKIILRERKSLLVY